jgi:predicted phosphoribosyltransferase
MPFKDRIEAGRKLAATLAMYGNQHPAILALPRGGVPVAAEVAAALHAPLDLVIVRKIGVPFQPELAMGAVVDGDAPIVVRNDDVVRLEGISEADFQAECTKEIAEIEKRRQRYLGDRERLEISGRTAIVIDDGIATGATTRVALQTTRRRNPSRLVLAVPVAPTEIIQRMRAECDDFVCLEEHTAFAAIGYYYRDFGQVSDDEVLDMLRRFPISSDARQPRERAQQ